MAGVACYPVHHKHPAHNYLHSHLHMLLSHQSTQPASGVALRAAELPILAQVPDCGVSPQRYTLCFGWTCWLRDATHCHLSSLMYAMQGSGNWVVPVFWSQQYFESLVQLLALPPVGGLVAHNQLGPSSVLGVDPLPSPSHSPSLCQVTV